MRGPELEVKAYRSKIDVNLAWVSSGMEVQVWGSYLGETILLGFKSGDTSLKILRVITGGSSPVASRL